jgi:hypothetical protein
MVECTGNEKQNDLRILPALLTLCLAAQGTQGKHENCHCPGNVTYIFWDFFYQFTSTYIEYLPWLLGLNTRNRNHHIGEML